MNLKWLRLVEQFAPLILAATPLAPIVPFVIVGISTAEKIKGATGAEKLALATQIVNAGVAATNAQAGTEKINPTLVNQAVTYGINAVVSSVNLVHSFQTDPAAPATQTPTK